MLQLMIQPTNIQEKKKVMIRDWRTYSKEKFISNLRVIKENYMDWILNESYTLLDRIILILFTVYDKLVPLQVAKVREVDTLNAKIELLRKRRD